jgi:hypothetical protein
MEINRGPKTIKVWYPTPDLPKSDQLLKDARIKVGRIVRFLTGFAFLLRQSAIVNQSRNPPLGDVSCRLCGEDDETPIHVICDCGHFITHRLDTIGVHQMPEKNPEWDMESMVKFLQLKGRLYLTVKTDTNSAEERTCILTSYLKH